MLNVLSKTTGLFFSIHINVCNTINRSSIFLLKLLYLQLAVAKENGPDRLTGQLTIICHS